MVHVRDSYYRTLIRNHITLSNGTTFNDVDWSLTGISRSRYFSTLNTSETTRDRAIVIVESQLNTDMNSSKHEHKTKTRNSAIADKPCDAFRGQSRSPNMVPFYMLRMVSYYCAIVTWSIGHTVFSGNSTSKKFVTLIIGLRVSKGHWKCHHSIQSLWLPTHVLL